MSAAAPEPHEVGRHEVGRRGGAGCRLGAPAGDQQVPVVRGQQGPVGQRQVVEHVVAGGQRAEWRSRLELEAQQHHDEPVPQVAVALDHHRRTRSRPARRERLDRGLEVGEPVVLVLVELGLIGTGAEQGVAAHQLLDPRHAGSVERRGHDHQLARHPAQLGQERGTGRRRHVLEHIARDHRVEGPVRERQAGAVGLGDDRIAEPLRHDVHVDADDLQAGIERLQMAGGVPHVEHAGRPGPEVGAQGSHDRPVAAVAIERGPGHLGVRDARALVTERFGHGSAPRGEQGDGSVVLTWAALIWW